MDIIKDPRITKASRAAVCLFAFLSMIGAFVFLFSSTAAAGMALAMSIVTFVLTLATIVLSYFSKNNFIFSLVGGGVAIIQFIMGLILGSTISIAGRIRLLFYPGGYVFATVILIIMSGLIMGVNLLGIFVKSEKSFVDGVRSLSQQSVRSPQQQMMSSAQMQTQQMMQQMQAAMTDQQPAYPQQVPYPQPLQQQFSQQAQQQPYPQPVQQPQPEQQQYQQTDNYNQQ